MHTVLAALDGSPRAAAVLAEATAIAMARGARLALVRSVGLPSDVPQNFWQTTEEPLLDLLEKRARAYLAECESRVPVEGRAGSHVVIGSPWEAICRVAQSLQADLVVIGSHGYSGFDRLLGTTAAKVVNHCPCSVLVVKEPASAPGR